MQGSFEKKVQEKLDELKMDPSAPVWEKIELEIKPDNKRRRGLLLISFLIVLLAGTGWLAFYQWGNKPVTHQMETPIARENQPASTRTTTGQGKNTITGTATRKTPDFNIVTTQTSQQAGTDLPAFHSGKVAEQETHSFNQAMTTTAVPLALQTKEGLVEKNTATTDARSETTLPGGMMGANQPDSSGQTNIIAQQNKEVAASDSAMKTEGKRVKEAGNEAPAPVTFKDSALIKKGIAAHTKKWQKRISLQGGWNHPGSFSFSTTRNFSTPAQQTSGGMINTGMPTGPNKVTAGSSYRLGAGVVRTLGKRWELSTGLEYAYHRLYTKVGSFSRTDTSFAYSGQRVQTGGYYRNGAQSDFTIHYHLLQIPVSVGYRPFASLTFSAGASYSRLLRSNALTYNAATNGYYYNRDNINSNFFSLFSSVQYRVINRTRFQVSLGPVVQYQLSSLQKEPAGQSGRLLITGIKAGINF